MGCLALVPVVLARRARYGGLARPAEFLTACCGLPEITANLGCPPGLLIAALLAAITLRSGRRRLPDWLLTALCMLAWLGIAEAGIERMGRGADLFQWYFGIRIRGLAGWTIYYFTPTFLNSLLYAVPAFVALRDLRRPDPPHRSWLEWTGLGLAAVLLASNATNQIIIDSHIRREEPWFRGQVVRELAKLVAIALSIPIAGRLGPAWSRRPTPKYTDTIGENGPAVP
jgi:hypothetical protein